MKATSYIYNKVLASLPLSVLLLSFTFGACDHIADNEQLIEVRQPDIKPTSTARNILIEDFTGQKCVNCPEGTKIIESLQEVYPDRIIAVGIYSGPFGKTPTGDLLPLSTKMGCDYYDHWQIPSQPHGMVNRGGPISHTKWINAVNTELGYVSEIKMELEATLHESTISISVKETSLGGAYSGNLQVWLLEDSIVGTQYMPDGSINKAYVHNHVFRTAVNGMWGDKLTLAQEESQTQALTQSVDVAWNKAHLSVVAFIYNDDGVEQAVKTPVKTSSTSPITKQIK